MEVAATLGAATPVAAVATSNECILALPDVGALTAGPEDAAETLLFLHGWGGSKELWWGALAALSDKFPLWRWTAGDGGNAAAARPANDARHGPLGGRNVFGRLGLPRVTLIGHSFGGNLAAQVALDFPELVQSFDSGGCRA